MALVDCEPDGRDARCGDQGKPQPKEHRRAPASHWRAHAQAADCCRTWRTDWRSVLKSNGLRRKASMPSAFTVVRTEPSMLGDLPPPDMAITFRRGKSFLS